MSFLITGYQRKLEHALASGFLYTFSTYYILNDKKNLIFLSGVAVAVLGRKLYAIGGLDGANRLRRSIISIILFGRKNGDNFSLTFWFTCSITLGHLASLTNLL